ncbi:MAG: hypothetical protein DRJ08_04970 [Acidobacteria bacterium]|nr:MAG: hypothetical protein DRJ14_09770 [Acidobacteriota bacterium]RLE21863.1 MAG: hypothetical protein DRJ08_04970 [Acidobacteriota bacterium]
MKELRQAKEWVILDIGFSNQACSCGLLITEEEKKSNKPLQFNKAKDKICTYIRNSKRSVNLLIEAPLSVAFDNNSNPKGRSIEKEKGKVRYWYYGPGCTVMVAAIYLIKAIAEMKPDVDILLFEGFVSFKKKGNPSDHLEDVRLLKEVVDNPDQFKNSIIESKGLAMDASDTLKSAFQVAGIDAGIPIVIKPD